METPRRPGLRLSRHPGAPGCGPIPTRHMRVPGVCTQGQQAGFPTLSVLDPLFKAALGGVRGEWRGKGSRSEGGQHAASLVLAGRPRGSAATISPVSPVTASRDPKAQRETRPRLTSPPALASACERGDPSRWSWSASSSMSSRTSPGWLWTCQEATGRTSWLRSTLTCQRRRLTYTY